MHPVLANRERFLVYLAAWVRCGHDRRAGVLYAGLSWCRRSPDSAAGSGLRVHLPRRVLPVPGRADRSPAAHPGARGPGGGAAFSLLLWLFLASTWVALLEQVPRLAALGERFRRSSRAALGCDAALVVSAALHYLYIAADAATGPSARRSRSNAGARGGVARAARQVDPHFLFNASTRSPARDRRRRQGPRMCLSLAELLREGLRLGGERGSRSSASWRSPTATWRSNRCGSGRACASSGGSTRAAPAGRAAAHPPAVGRERGHPRHRRPGRRRHRRRQRRPARAADDRHQHPYDAARRGRGGVGLANVRARLAAAYGERAR